MLQASATPAAASPLPWAHLDVPHRIARVLDAARLVGGNDCVTRDDYKRAPETCDHTQADIESNIGEAQRILLAGTVEPKYDRAQRLAAAVSIVGGLMPMIADMHSALRVCGFPHAEIADLWGDVVAGAGTAFAEHCRATPDIPDWGREMLAQRAD
jgi:hypothetical protein